jgi:hypothetical protein
MRQACCWDQASEQAHQKPAIGDTAAAVACHVKL